MPIYEYKCEKCNSIIEKIQKFSDPLLTECEKCGGNLNKLLSQSSFALKGSGWYVTDYAKKTTGVSEPKSEKTETTTEPSSSEAKTTTPCAATTGGCGSEACNVTSN
ncbi:MAG: transcriptional regulator [Acidobacteria bacterium]|nr:transcriptional regulator [Acidobacteriota bacterium]